MAGWPMVLGGVLVAVLGILSSIELDEADILLVERGGRNAQVKSSYLQLCFQSCKLRGGKGNLFQMTLKHTIFYVMKLIFLSNK